MDLTLEAFDALLAQHRDVVGRSRSLHSSCEQLVREKEALMEFAEAMRAKLRFFDEFETVAAQFAALSVAQSSGVAGGWRDGPAAGGWGDGGWGLCTQLGGGVVDTSSN